LISTAYRHWTGVVIISPFTIMIYGDYVLIQT